MKFDFSTLIWVLIAIMALQPLLTGRWYALQWARAIRGHWGIENGLHWVLDVTFREDGSRSRPEHGAENLAWLRRMAVSLLRNDTTCARSLRQKSIKALCDHKFLLQLLSQVNGPEVGT